MGKVKTRDLIIFPFDRMGQRSELNVLGLGVSYYGCGLLWEVRRSLRVIDGPISKE